MQFTYTKAERLKSKKAIESLFSFGKYLRSFPVRVVYLKVENSDNEAFQVGFSVSKRHFKSAVDRNRVKRLMREAYRLHKHDLPKQEKNQYIAMFLFSDSKKPTFQTVEKAMIALLQQLGERMNA